jgi:hypothetical protein
VGTRIRVGGGTVWLGLTALTAVLGTVEIAAMAFLGHRFLPAPAAWILDGLGAALLLVVSFAVASVLWRSHYVADRQARLVLGWLGDVTVPLSSILAVSELSPLTPMESDRTGPVFDGPILNLVAAQGLSRVCITFIAPIRGRRLWQNRAVTSVEVCDPDHRLATALRRANG